MLRFARMQQQQSRKIVGNGCVVRTIDTPLGQMLAVASSQGIERLEFDRDDEPAERPHERSDESAQAQRHLDELAIELSEYFAGKRTAFSVRVNPPGSDFEKRAWQFLRSIPFGQTRSYGQQARAISGINAARAVGGANGRNPIAIVIPCHRVIGADGSLTGFASGLHRKEWLLRHEGAGCCQGAPTLFTLSK